MSKNSTKGEEDVEAKGLFYGHPLAPYAVFFFLLFAACLPVVLPNNLPLQDYPAHLARLYIMHDGILNETIATYFGVNWHFVANLALEIFTYPFVEVFSPDMAGRIFICTTFFLLTSGTIAVYRSLGGKGYWPYVSFMFLYSDVLIYGFLSFLFSCGLALWTFAFWLRMQRSSILLRLAVFAMLAFLLLASHLFAFCFYALMVGSYELSRLLERKKMGQTLINLNFWVTIIHLVPAIILFITMSETADAANVFIVGSLKSKLAGLSAILALYNMKLQLSLVFLSAFIIYILRDKGVLVFDKKMRIFLGFALLIFLVAPIKAFASFHLDYRIPSVFIFAIIASMNVHKRIHKAEAFIWLFMAVCLAHYTYIGSRWLSFDAQYEDLYKITEDIQEGDTLIHVTMSKEIIEENLAGPYVHAPAALIIAKHVITPYIFADPRHQPIYYKAGMSDDIQSEYIEAIIPYQNTEQLHEEFDALNNKNFTRFKYLLLINFNETFMQKSTVWHHQKSLGVYSLYVNSLVKPCP